MLKIYCDGACRGNQFTENIGSYAGVFIVRDECVCVVKNATQNTTNNKMELMAVVESLKAVIDKEEKVEVYCDSAYVINGLNSWLANWKKNGWKSANKKPVLNAEIWRELDDLRGQFSDIKFLKVAGHSGDKWNDEVDKWCNIAMDELK